MVYYLFVDLLWVSPEILRLGKLPTPAHYQYADIYSLSIIMHELFQRNGPFGIETRNMQPRGNGYKIRFFNSSVNTLRKKSQAFTEFILSRLVITRNFKIIFDLQNL